MRKYSIFALASVAALSLSVSCSKEKDVLAPETEKITITASFPEEGLTKVGFVEDGYNGKLNLIWQAGDQITITDEADPSNTQTFDIVSGVGTKSATFSGTAPAAAASYKIIYNGNPSYAIQTQAADGDTGHLKYEATLTGVTDYSSFTFTAAASSAVLRLRTKIPAGFYGNVKSVVIKAGTAFVKVDITDSADAGETNVFTVYASLPGEMAIAAGTELYVSFMMDETKAYLKHTAYRVLPAMTIEAGKVNTINLNCSAIETSAGAADDGTAAMPYLIADQYQMNAMHNVMADNAKKYFKMVEDVDMTGVVWAALNSQGEYLKGIDFDGGGHVVKHLTCNTNSYPSFVGVLNGAIRNVTFDGANISGGSAQAGVVAGYIGTVVNNNNYPATCSNVTVSNSSVSITATSKNRNVGGFAAVVGSNKATLTNCHVIGTTVTQNTTTANGCSAGGFAGNVNTGATLDGCTVTADVDNKSSYYTGGFFGQFGSTEKSTITNCAYLGGTISAGRAADNSPVGGFAGRIANGGAEFTNCYVEGATINASNSGRVGGFVGDSGTSDSSLFTYCYVNKTNVSGALNTGGFSGVFYVKAEKCFVESTSITANANNVGGFVGYMQKYQNGIGVVDNCYASATINGGTHSYIGGFVGNSLANSTIESCYEKSTVSGSVAGAFIGHVEAAPVSITKNIAWETGSLNFVGDVKTGISIDNIVNNYLGTTGTVSSQAQTLGWDSAIWDFSTDYPTLK